MNNEKEEIIRVDKVDPKDGSTVEIYYTISGMD